MSYYFHIEGDREFTLDQLRDAVDTVDGVTIAAGVPARGTNPATGEVVEIPAPDWVVIVEGDEEQARLGFYDGALHGPFWSDVGVQKRALLLARALHAKIIGDEGQEITRID